MIENDRWKKTWKVILNEFFSNALCNISNAAARNTTTTTRAYTDDFYYYYHHY